jgi:hypothetical protein
MMATTLTKSEFLSDLNKYIQEHCETVTDVFQPLDERQLNWQDNRKDWSILQCFDHLNLTFAYYLSRIELALSNPKPAVPDHDLYTASLWGRIYMYFAFNPKLSFPTAKEITPQSKFDRAVLETYLANQDQLSDILGQVERIDLSRTPVPLEKGVKFNLGDCLKVLVYHDDLHIKQAKGVLSALRR